MTTTAARPIGHPTLTAKQLAPSVSAAFSPNLHKYLKSRGHFYKDGGLLDAVYVALPDTRAEKWFGAGTLVLGYLDDDFFVGTRLLSALCNSSQAERGAHPCTSGLELVEGFWDSYLKIGRCAIDPAHQEHFQADRFREHADGRECLWCGHRQRKVVMPRVVYDTTWVAE